MTSPKNETTPYPGSRRAVKAMLVGMFGKDVKVHIYDDAPSPKQREALTETKYRYQAEIHECRAYHEMERVEELTRMVANIDATLRRYRYGISVPVRLKDGTRASQSIGKGNTWEEAIEAATHYKAAPKVTS